jgi:hypothetical protein
MMQIDGKDTPVKCMTVEDVDKIRDWMILVEEMNK